MKPLIVYTTSELNMIGVDLIEKVKLPYTIQPLVTFTKEYINRLFPDKEIILEIVVTDNNEMKRLNIKYLQKNKAADVLSFPIWKNKKEISEQTGVINLGTIFININEIAFSGSAEKYIVHGLDHLIGKHHR